MRQVKNVYEAVEAGGPGHRPLARFAIARLDAGRADRAAQRTGARELLVALARASLGVTVDADAIRAEPDGRPVLFDGDEPWPGLCISLSHSRRWVAAGLARGGSLGIDVEQEDPRRPLEGMAAYMGWRAPTTPAGFYRAWCYREARLKCAGGQAPATDEAHEPPTASVAPSRRHVLYDAYAPGLHACAVLETRRPMRVEWLPVAPERLAVWP